MIKSERAFNMYETLKENSHHKQYQESGGIINEVEYESALMRARNTETAPEKILIRQAEYIAEFAGIELHNTKDASDPRAVLYAILRADAKPKEIKDHHSQMSDQRIFAEVLRMHGDTDALNKLIAAYHKIGTYCPICLKVAVSDEECR